MGCRDDVLCTSDSSFNSVFSFWAPSLAGGVSYYHGSDPLLLISR